MKIYISASLVNHLQNKRVADVLEIEGFEVILPQRFCPEHVPHDEYSYAIFKECLDAMKQCDAGLLLLDGYGKDSAWECGWFNGAGKPLIGFAQIRLQIAKDWMVKGGLQGIITTDKEIQSIFEEDPILSINGCKTIFIDSINVIGPALIGLLK